VSGCSLLSFGLISGRTFQIKLPPKTPTYMEFNHREASVRGRKRRSMETRDWTDWLGRRNLGNCKTEAVRAWKMNRSSTRDCNDAFTSSGHRTLQPRSCWGCPVPCRPSKQLVPLQSLPGLTRHATQPAGSSSYCHAGPGSFPTSGPPTGRTT
jgi:hypothetical protein